MPCYDPPRGASDYYENFEHNSPLADMLCTIMRGIESRGALKAQELRTQAWWEEHKKRDAKKRRQEEAQAKEKANREAALKKLSPAERKALGIRD